MLNTEEDNHYNLSDLSKYKSGKQQQKWSKGKDSGKHYGKTSGKPRQPKPDVTEVFNRNVVKQGYREFF